MTDEIKFCPKCEKMLQKQVIDDEFFLACSICDYREKVLIKAVESKLQDTQESPEQSPTLEVDENEEEEEEEDESLDRSFDESLKVNLDRKDRTLLDLKRAIEKKRMDLQPDFQRKGVWDDKLASRLIESIILGLPIPIIFTAEMKVDNSDNIVEVVIDGQQRLDSINRYMSDNLSLRNLEILDKSFDRKKFSDLDESFQQKIEEYALTVVKVKLDSDPDVKYHLFSRINRGSINLNPQELRNCIFRGKLNELLKELTEYSMYKEIYQKARGKATKNRMQDAELILRFIALYERTPDHYSYPMKSFLNRFMEENREPSDARISTWRDIFKKTISTVREILGDTPFKRIDYLSGEGKKIRGRKSLLNEALYDCFMYVFAQFEKGELMKIKDAIQEEIADLITCSERFKDAISGGRAGSTSMVKHLQTRIKIFRHAIDSLVEIYDTNQGSRFYSQQIKQQLFDKQRGICPLCNQSMGDLMYTDIHHVEEYWRGGKTIPKNAALTHRYCNRAQKTRINPN